MSFSFSSTGKSKLEARTQAVHEFHRQVVAQRTHDVDRPVIAAAIEGAVDSLGDPAAGEEIKVAVYGSASQEYFAGGPGRIVGCSFTVSAAIQKQPDQPKP